MEKVDIKPHADFSGAWSALLSEISIVRGDIAEFGVFNGGSTRILSRMFPDRMIWAFDTYDGMPEQDFDPDLDHDPPGSFKPLHTLEEMFGEYENIIPIQGRFSRTLPMLPLRPKIALAYIDCDLYESARGALSWLSEHLIQGGIIFLDDYATHKGIQKAVDEFVARYKLSFDGKHVIDWVPAEVPEELQ